MWMLLIAFQFSREECQAVGQLNVNYWQSTGQKAGAVCMRTIET